MTGGWRRPDVDRSNGCRMPDCPLGCTEIPTPAVYARAAVLARQHAEDYHETRGQGYRAAAAERSAAWLEEMAEYGSTTATADRPQRSLRVHQGAPSPPLAAPGL